LMKYRRHASKSIPSSASVTYDEVWMMGRFTHK
jgi:hypothetical protein